jgi:hypothetical protein
MNQHLLAKGFLPSVTILAVLGLLLGDGTGSLAQQQNKQGQGKGVAARKQNKPTPPVRTAPPAPRSSLLTSDAWKNAPLTPVTPQEIDSLVATELKASGIQPTERTTDEEFLRRVTLDLTGKLPTPTEVTAFVADQDPRKRARVIDRLLESDAYASHWAHYWRDVIAARVAERRGLALQRSFEKWMTEQLKSNQGWDQIVRAMLTADGSCRFDDDGQHGAAFFLASHMGADAANAQAAETARIFLGIQIQCAQCHDHPSDQWKRVQFHELAGYFARLRERPIREEKKLVGLQLISAPRGEHQMPDKEDPKKSYTTYPRFLDGKWASKDRPDLERRRDLARAITDPGNYWFSGAYVNRIWGELLGQSFYQPVDDMGPNKEAVFGPVLVRLASSFRATHYDVKALYRAILNSQTYQRKLRSGEGADGHLHFAAAYPTRLPAESLWASLTNALGHLGPPPAMQARLKGRPFAMFGLEGLFKTEFSFDPSARADEIEGSIPQALLLMNNPAIQNRMSARGDTALARILKENPDDDKAIAAVYLQVLARKPTDRELARCRDYIAKVGNRPEAFEDLLWTLVNSTEFQTKR